MTIIDSQVHAYEANTQKRPWHNVPNWPDHVTGDEMVVAMDKVGVDGATMPGVSSAACGARTGHAHTPSSTTSKPSNPSSRLTA